MITVDMSNVRNHGPRLCTWGTGKELMDNCPLTQWVEDDGTTVHNHKHVDGTVCKKITAVDGTVRYA
jgi:hypothetical protein